MTVAEGFSLPYSRPASALANLGIIVMKILMRYPLFLALGITLSCSSKTNSEGEKNGGNASEPTKPKQIAPGLESRPLAQARPGTGNKLFTKVLPEESGIEFENFLKPENIRKYIENGSGLTVGDYDNDGQIDIFLVSLDGTNKLFRQTAPWKFEDVTDAAGGLGGGDAWGTGATFVDIDNDGDLDLYVCNLKSVNLLYINKGDGTFDESAKAFGLDHTGASVVASFADFDLDGDLDMYLLTNRVFSAQEEVRGHIKLPTINGRLVVPPALRDQFMLLNGHMTPAGQQDLLFRNEGNGTFTDVTKKSGIAGYDMGLGVTWFDYDQDRYPDIYISNDLKTPDRLYRNNGDGTFTESLARATVQSSWLSMGSDSGDINNDGRFDLLTSDMAATTHFKAKATMGNMGDSVWFLTSGRPRQAMTNSLFLGTGTPRFLEMAKAAGVSNTNWTWSVRFGDLDNDGFLDLHVTNGMSRQLNNSDHVAKILAFEKSGKGDIKSELGLVFPKQEEANITFRNTGGLRFEDVSGPWGLDHVGISHGAVQVDIDGDGDLDILTNNLNAAPSLHRNNSVDGHRVTLELRGSKSNHFGVGAVVRIRTESELLSRQLFPTRGYMSTGAPEFHFGLGEHVNIEELTVEWPSGQVQKFSNIPADLHYIVSEPDSPIAKAAKVAQSPALFRESARELGLAFNHKELPFNDYEREPLLPYKLSKQGPGLAWGDVNGDGSDDLFVAGAAGQPGGLFVSKTGGGFERTSGPWEPQAASEDTAIVFFDVDGDGDQDLYVGHGGTEAMAGDALYQDSLFINDGKGQFKASKNALPKLFHSTGALSVADYDNDGDLDIFVGSRSVPGAYPLTPKSFLLQNKGGRFTDVTSTVPGLGDVGLVTGATWTDHNADGWTDLVIANDWGAVRIFTNGEGNLNDTTEAAGLGQTLGLWRGVVAGDVDGDGDMDLLATNLGHNTKYHASAERPMMLYYKDFDGNGSIDIVEAEYEDDNLYPGRGRSCSSGAMPFVADKFPTFNGFAKANLDAIYDIENAPVQTANYLGSAVFINDGKGNFEVRELPALAQNSTAHGIALSDLDGDGHLDAYLGQNFFGAQPETGLMAGGLGLVLKGTGSGEFVAQWPKESGIVMPEPGMGVAIADIDGNGSPDLAVGGNHAPIRVFHNQILDSHVAIRLAGPKGNPTGVGAIVRVTLKDGTSSSQQVSAGSGYMSSSSQTLYFGKGKSAIQEVVVSWPGGTESKVLAPESTALTIRYQ